MVRKADEEEFRVAKYRIYNKVHEPNELYDDINKLIKTVSELIGKCPDYTFSKSQLTELACHAIESWKQP